MPMDQVMVGPHPVPDGVDTIPRGDNYGNKTIQYNGPWYREIVQRGLGFNFTQATAGVPLFTPMVTATIATTNFVIDRRYRIVNVGDTDFTLIGASANTIGVEFIATGVGGGATGTADRILNNFLIQNPTASGKVLIPLKVTFAMASTTIATVLSNLAVYLIPNASVDMGGITGYVSPLSAFVGAPTSYSSSMIFTPASGTPPIVGQSTSVTPTFMRTLGLSMLANDLASKTTWNFDVDFEDAFMLYPGYTMCIAPVGETASLCIISLFGVEIAKPA